MSKRKRKVITVAELVALLQAQDPAAQVWRATGGHGAMCEVHEVQAHGIAKMVVVI